MLRLTTALVATLAIVSLGNHASAQPGADAPPPPPGPGPSYGTGPSYVQPPPPPPHRVFMPRRGFTLGFGFGLGGMSAESGPISCYNCDYEPAAAGVDFHIGGMLNPRLALLFEVWVTGQAIEASGREVLLQTMAMAALQYWLTPQLWIKAGIGAADLSMSIDDGYSSESVDIDTGAAVMGAIGYEVMATPRFAIDVQLRLGSGTYDNFIQDQISAGTLSVGFNWF